MIYKKYGQVFRKFRLERGYKLTDFEVIGISKSSLSKFEKGVSMLTFDRLLKGLQEMNISLSEFELCINDFEPDGREEMLNLLDTFVINQDKIKIKEFKERFRESDELIYLAAKSTEGKLAPEECEIVFEYLNSISYWTYYNLSLFYHTMESLSTKEIFTLVSIFLIKPHNIFHIKKHRYRVLQVIYRSAAIFSYRGEREMSEFIYQQTEKYVSIQGMFLTNIRNLALGYTKYCFEDQKKGEEMMNRSLKSFKELSTPETYYYYKSLYKRLMERNQW